MSNVITSNVELQNFTDSCALDILDEFRANHLKDGERFEDYREDMFDSSWETADSCEHVIYTHRAIQIAANCDCSDGEDFLEDVGMPSEISFGSIATAIAFGEIKARIDAELSDLIEAADGELDELEEAENDDSDD